MTDAIGNKLESRLAHLEAIQDIHALRQRYALAADAKYHARGDRHKGAILDAAVNAQVSCFTPDALWHGGPFGGDIQGREALRGFFLVSPWHFTSHHYSNVDLRIQGQRAEGSWRLVEIGVRESDKATVLITGRTAETYRKDLTEGWLISSFAFEQLHSVELSREAGALRCLIPAGEEA
jgi:hypothetical protein